MRKKNEELLYSVAHCVFSLPPHSPLLTQIYVFIFIWGGGGGRQLGAGNITEGCDALGV